MSQKKVTHNLTISIAKFLAIIMVVIGHVIQYSIPDFDKNIIYRLIYSVHMPLFFFLAGYVAAIKNDFGKYTAQIEKKTLNLLVPFLIWLPLNYIIIKYVQAPPDFYFNILDFLINALKNPDTGGLWFLLVLYECHLLIIYIKFIKYDFYKSALIILIFLNLIFLFDSGLNYLGLNFLRWYFLFFILGFFVGEKRYSIPSAKQTFYIVILYSILFIGWSRKHIIYNFENEFIGNLLSNKIIFQGYTAMLSLCGIWLVFFISHIISLKSSQNFCISIINHVSDKTLQIYAGHYLFLYLYVKIFYENKGQFLYVLVSSCIIVFMSILMGTVLKKNITLGKLLYGK